MAVSIPKDILKTVVVKFTTKEQQGDEAAAIVLAALLFQLKEISESKTPELGFSRVRGFLANDAKFYGFIETVRVQKKEEEETKKKEDQKEIITILKQLDLNNKQSLSEQIQTREELKNELFKTQSLLAFVVEQNTTVVDQNAALQKRLDVEKAAREAAERKNKIISVAGLAVSALGLATGAYFYFYPRTIEEPTAQNAPAQTQQQQIKKIIPMSPTEKLLSGFPFVMKSNEEEKIVPENKQSAIDNFKKVRSLAEYKEKLKRMEAKASYAPTYLCPLPRSACL